MYYIIYLSAGTSWFSSKELEDLLAVSVANNRRNNITGMLLYANGNFIQLLEGNEHDVQQAFSKISADSRHNDVTRLASGTNELRLFPEWNMGFRSVGALSTAPFKPVLDEALANANSSNGQLALKMLNAFVRSARL